LEGDGPGEGVEIAEQDAFRARFGELGRDIAGDCCGTAGSFGGHDGENSAEFAGAAAGEGANALHGGGELVDGGWPDQNFGGADAECAEDEVRIIAFMKGDQRHLGVEHAEVVEQGEGPVAAGERVDEAEIGALLGEHFGEHGAGGVIGQGDDVGIGEKFLKQGLQLRLHLLIGRDHEDLPLAEVRVCRLVHGGRQGSGRVDWPGGASPTQGLSG
jgi:hypothetical protein